MADLVVTATNLHNERAAVNWLRRRSRADAPDHFDIGFVSEAHRRRKQLRGLPGHNYHTGSTRGPSQEVGILLDRRLPLLGESSALVSEAIGGKLERVGKERWGRTITTRIGDTVTTAVTVHPVAGVKLRTGDLPDDHVLVQRYDDAMTWLDATIIHHRSLGHEVIVGGDIQVTPVNQKPWSIYPLLAAHGLEIFRDGIDLIAWTNGFVLGGNPMRRVFHDFPSDGHPAIVIQLDLARIKRRRR